MGIDRQVPVLIVGGGISGLTAALFLLKHGVTPMVIERHKTTSIHPRARGFDVRTMELYRELQLSEPIRNAGKALAPAWGIHTGSSLADVLKNKKPRKGEAISSPLAMKGMEELAAQSPEAGARCTQDLSEPVLLEAATERGAEICLYTELVSFSQDGHGVTVLIRNRETDQRQTIRALYMIAADGAKSNIRETLHAETVGKGVLGNLLNIYFEADLGTFVKGREFSILRIDEPDIKGMLTSINNSDRWVFHLHYDAANGESPEDFTEKRLIAILEKIIGLQLNIRIISVLPWQPTVKVVKEMRHGRIFLAGDAAHIMTPYGGKGANSGIQDVHNLAWKIAAVIHGKAGPALLHTYSAERQPVGWYNADQSGKMANQYGLVNKVMLKFFVGFVSVMLIRALHLQKVFSKTAILQLGGLMGLPEYQYASTAVIGEDAVVSGYRKAGLLTGKPGTRMPHLWVQFKDRKISTLDLLGNGFVLFTGIQNKEWQQAAIDIASKLGVDVRVYSIGHRGDLITEKIVQQACGITDNGAVLVRPDGFVAWRAKNRPADPTSYLADVLRVILSAKIA